MSFVYAVDYAGAALAPDAGERIPAVEQQRVYKRAVGMSGRGCTTMPRGLFTTMRSSSP